MDNLTQEKLNLLYQAIDQQLESNTHVVLAIDGPCTAGKTTLADILNVKYACNVIHMDQFFLRPEQRTAERLAQPGGNVDYERFQAEVLQPLKAGMTFSYRPFCCSTQSLDEPVAMRCAPLTVIEGTYSTHPYFQNPYHITVFLSIDPDTQRERINLRPAWKHERFFKEWIPMEQAYFDHFHIPQNCSLVL